MSQKVMQVLFVCQDNSVHSILAEATLNALGGDRFHAYSAGILPAHAVHPLTIATLESFRLPVVGLGTKSCQAFSSTGAPRFDLVISLADHIDATSCDFNQRAVVINWHVEETSEGTGTVADRARQYKDIAISLRRRIELLLALPVASMDRLTLQWHAQEIGEAEAALS